LPALANALRDAVRAALRGALACDLGVATACVAAAAARPLAAAELPVVCIAGSCGSGLDLDPAVASLSLTPNALNIQQHVDNAVLNWSSFNISRDGSVTFEQPSTSSVALNRIHQNSPSEIFGALHANGRVYLLNQNGILFGDGARVDVGGLLATSLDLTPDALSGGLTAPSITGGPSLVQYRDSAGNALPSGAVGVARGATIRTAEGGSLLVFAPEISNEGTLKSPGGQTVLAAGNSIFLATSSDPNLRGLLVEVGTGGTVTNGGTANAGVTDPAALLGQIFADRGNVTLAGLAVNQSGRVSATTSVRANGSIRLQARDGAAAGAPSGRNGGAVTLGQHSVTEVALETTGETTVDVNAQPKSMIDLQGRTIDVLGGSQVIAKSGTVRATALEDWTDTTEFRSERDSSRLYLADDALIDVSGEQIDLDMERNTVQVELRGSQLADSPAQRDGALRSQKVRVDIRRSGTRPDGTTWQGTPLADVSGDIGTIARTVQERSLTGGTVNLTANGDVVVSEKATVDVSGGSIHYRDGFINTSQVIDSFGRPFDIGDADPDRTYVAIADSFVVKHEKWGVTETFPGFLGGQSRFEAGYVEGKDAGSIQLVGSRAIADGRFVATTETSRYQRNAPAPIPSGAIYRPYDQRPLGGLLVVGSDTRAAVSNRPRLTTDFVFEDGLQLPAVAAELGGTFDPLAEELPASAATFKLRPELLEQSGFTRLNVLAQDSAVLASDVSLALAPNATLTFDAVHVEVDGAIRSAGGALTLSGGTLSIGANARVDLSGLWTNDNPVLNPLAEWTPIATAGGAVTMVGAVISTAPGSSIDVSAGAWSNSRGSVSLGKGGALSFSTTGGGIAIEGDLRAYGFQHGGSLSIKSPYICITASDCPAFPDNALLLAPELFAAGTFESYSFQTSFAFRERSGTVVDTTQKNLDVTGDLASIETGTPVSEFTRVTTLPVQSRSGAKFSVSHAFVPLPDQELDAATFGLAGDIVLEAGSALIGDVGSSFSFKSNARTLLDGAILAPGGSISASVAGPPVFPGIFVPSHGLWVGRDARLSAAGAALTLTSDLGLRYGQVIDGGSVTLDSGTGYVVLNPGAVVDVSGAAATLDVRTGYGASTAYEPRVVGSSGGSIAISAAQGIVNSADLRLQSGQPGAVPGGSLTFALLENAPYIGPGRTIQVQQTLAPLAVGYATDVSFSLNGLAPVSASAINNSGTDSVTLSADNQLFGSGLGAISFVGDVSLHPRTSLILNAAELRSGGGTADLGSAYVALGRPDNVDQRAIAAPQVGDGALHVSANLIDLIGNFAVSGFKDAALRSAGDIRERGVQLVNTQSVTGRLATTADLVLEAQQIYPTTLSDFTVSVARTEDGAPAGRLDLRAAPGEPGALLSAGGSAHFEADTIEQNGRVRVPFGTITFAARDLTLGPASVTATSGAGELIPFGTTQGGFDWVYALPDNLQTLVFNDKERDLPAQHVDLSADSITVLDGAVLDLRGGGDLLAYEWVPGIGGTRDILSTSVRPNQYAILPGSALQYAPIDPTESRGFLPKPGSSVTLASGVAGLAPGTYALLPARYALLPGAFLVTPTAGYSDIVPGESFAQLDGGIVIAGTRTIAGTSLTGSRTEGFAIQPGARVFEEARYDLSYATQFFSAGATAAAFRTPRDAGTLALLPRESLSLGGSLLASPAEGGRGASLEITAEQLRIATTVPSVPEPGVVTIAAPVLNTFGADSLLLGARTVGQQDRVDPAGETERFAVLGDLASRLIVDSGVELSAGEIVLAASNEAAIAAGARIEASGGGPQNFDHLAVNGDAAIARLSGGDQAVLSRTAGPGATGSISLEAGSLLSAAGSLLLDVTSASALNGTLSADGAALWLGATSIALGEAPAGAAALSLDEAQLGGLNPRELVLASRGSIDAYGPVRLSAQQLSLLTDGIRAATPDASLRVDVAGDLTLAAPLNALTFSPIGGTSAAATVDVTAGSIETGAGALAFAGFRSVRLASGGDMRFAGTGSLSADGDLKLVAATLRSANGVGYRVTTPQTLSIVGARAPAQASAVDSGIGSRLDLAAGAISIDTAIELPAGILTAVASGDIVLGANGRLRAPGASASFDGQVRAAPGGRVSLLSQGGSVSLLDGSLIDVAAATDGAASGGVVELLAPRGSLDVAGDLRGAAPPGADGGRIIVDAQSFGAFSPLNAELNAGGFTGERHIRQRGVGDIVISGTDVVAAHEVDIAADQGALSILGTIDARGSTGGAVSLYARDDVTLNGSIFASADSTSEDGGRVEIGSTQGAVLLRSGSIDVSGGSGARGGTVDVRIRRDRALSLLDGDPANDALSLASDIRGYRMLTVEGYSSYVDADGSLSSADIDQSMPWYQDAAAFVADAPALASALGRASDASFRIAPGIEIASDTSLSLDAAWDLTGVRFGGVAGVLTLEAADDLLINASLDDAPVNLALATRDSWQYRLVAGRDSTGADPLAVRGAYEIGDAGDFEIAAGLPGTPTRVGTRIAVRTATGRIDVSAARDFLLDNQAAVLYTSGIASATGIAMTNNGGLGGRRYPTDGGDIRISAGRDVKMLGDPNTQLVTDWLWRTGSNSNATSSAATAWTVNFDRFEQNVAVLGGGNLEVFAAGDVLNFSASIPSIGRQVGSTKPANNVVEVIDGGRLDVRAGGSILGGSFYVGLGSANLAAGGAIGRATSDGFAPVLALGDASFSLQARDGIELAGVVTPFFLPHGRSQTGLSRLNQSFFSTYSDQSRIDALSAAGSIKLGGTDVSILGALTSLRTDVTGDLTLRVFPPTLDVTALGGDLYVDTLTLYPSPEGTFNFFANGNVFLGTPGAPAPPEIKLSDADPAFLLTVARPLTDLTNINVFDIKADAIRTGNAASLPGFYSPIPTHSAARRADELADNDPARIVAVTGDVQMLGADSLTAASGLLFAAKPVAISAGRDILDFAMQAQNLDVGSVSSLSAGRDITFSLGRLDNGKLLPVDRAIALSGPGQMSLAAGRNIDLQTSQGVLSRGDLYNAALPNEGAAISLLAGLQGKTPDYPSFIDAYLVKSDAYDDRLLAYVRDVLGVDGTDKTAALDALRAAEPTRQRSLLESILFAELRAGGRAAAGAGPGFGDYTRAFTALTTMFPGSNPDPDIGETNAYAGDVRLFFSQVYTLDGGDISLLAPGGEINVGLATPPKAFGINKGAAQLGIVAQTTGNVDAASFGDFQVNESRTFAADGGNILVWSTRGDIDAGRGAKTAISAPPPTITVDLNGAIQVIFPQALTGSGIQTLATTEGQKPGDVDLYAPRGVVNAGDAGIVAGNLTIGATAVLGADNISVSGVSVGVPVDTGGFASALTGVSAVAASAANTAEQAVTPSRQQTESETPLAEQALGFLDVFITGFGEPCDPKKEDCSKDKQQ
jgi:filamentous hemagglutinin family protein